MIIENKWLLIHDLKKILVYFAKAIDYLNENKYYTYSNINFTITIIMMKVYLLTNFIINFNINEIDDAFNEVPELKRDKVNNNIPIKTWEFFN